MMAATPVPAVEQHTRSDLTIKVSDLVLDYIVHEDRRAALRQRIVTRTGTGKSVVRALDGVSFEALEGDTIGVVGPNGSGKSTLMAAVAGMLPPTSGEVLVAEEPKLLGVGATLIPGTTGRRNIRIGCMALGMKAAVIDEQIDDIIEFTGLGDAVNRPLRTYSTGMRARLHFAIATAVKPRILLIDEALAVGDRAFRQKSKQRINEIVSAAGTLMLVSHSMGAIRQMCSRAIWIEKGRVVADGPVDEVLEAYDQS